MPVDKPKSGETEEHYLAYCIPEEIKAGKDKDVAAAICYSTYRESKMSTELTNNQNDSDEQKLLDTLPEIKKGETEDDYINRCIPCLYPDTYDQQQAASFCADHYGNKATLGLKKQIMKAQPQSPFQRKAEEFRLLSSERDLRLKGINLADYPWDKCIADMTERYDAETAPKVCGMIKAKYGNAKG